MMPGGMLATLIRVCLSGVFVRLSRLTTMQSSPAPYVYSTMKYVFECLDCLLEPDAKVR